MSLAQIVQRDGVFVDGDWVESKDQDPDGDVRLIQLADVGDGVFVDKSARFLTSAKARELKCTFLERGDILVARMPDPLGRACVFPGDDRPCVTVVDVCIVRPSKATERRWLLHAINSPQFRRQIERHIKGTTRQRISRTNLGSIELDVPLLEEQSRLADILDKADAIRRKRKEAIVLTEELLRSAFLDMFGDPLTNPKGWEVKPLGDASEVAGGLQVTHARAGNPVPMPYLRVANVYRERLDLSDVKEIRLTVAEAERARLQVGDVLVVEGHGNPDELGRAAVWDGAIEVCTHQNHLIRVRADRRRLLPAYVSAYLNSSAGRAQMLRLGKTTSGLNTISTNNVRNVSVLVPPLNLQESFVRVVRATRHLAARLTDSRQQSEGLFDTLVQRAFSGELASVGRSC